MKPFKELKSKIPVRDLTLEMVKVGPNEWSAVEWSAEMAASKELIVKFSQDKNKKQIISKILEWFNWSAAFLNVPKLRGECVRESSILQEEIDAILKPYIVYDVVKELQNNFGSWDNGHRKFWRKSGLLTEEDERKIKQMKVVRDLAFKWVQEWIDHRYTIRNITGFPEDLPAPLEALSLAGFIDHDKIKGMWDKKKRKSSI
jgi:hypothetical protein